MNEDIYFRFIFIVLKCTDIRKKRIKQTIPKRLVMLLLQLFQGVYFFC